MLNYLYNTSLKVNAVSGTIVKNYKDSFFVHFQLGSNMGKSLLSKNPNIRDKQAVVIQCMCAGGNDVSEIIAEVMWKEDFDKLFEDIREEEESSKPK